ncbi:transcriptional regulator, TetR family [Pseudomonas luteola]|uniref:Transcriptional regulator, TetR family n=2 Tax=Pseudomonas TaxID=286 RepID=A0A2X2BYT4_PSELU|nr:transcriptional regulator, TetR family [Pseudomonas luteola]
MHMTDKARFFGKRIPQQARGKLRYERILSASVRLIENSGSTQFTMQELARESKTSIGSLYHFFNDKREVLDTLVFQHFTEFSSFFDIMERYSDANWSECSPQEVVERSVLPILNYIACQADLLVMFKEGYDGFNYIDQNNIEVRFLALHSKILKIRLPYATVDQCNIYAQTIISLFNGPLGLNQNKGNQNKHIILVELPRAISAYIKALEELHTS